MQRYRTYGQMDDQPAVSGDAAFTRLDMLTDPAVLPPGALAVCENMRFDANGTTVRAGLARQFPVGASLGTIRYAGLYSPAAGDTRFALVLDGALVVFRPDVQTWATYYFPADQLGGSATGLIQAGVGLGSLPQLYIQRGLSADVLVFDGTGVTAASGFPRSEFGLFYQDRIAVNESAQALKVSDFLDFTTFNLLNQFQIEKGGSDYLVLVLPYQKDFVLIGSRQAWFIAFFDPAVGSGGYVGGLNQDTSFLRSLTKEAGPVGARAAIEALGKIWFISDGAIYAFTPTLDNNLIVLGRPLSADVQPIMDRMSAKYAQNACVERWGYRLYFALPISDEPVSLTAITVTGTTVLGVDLPFDVPVNLASGALATVTTATPHNLTVGDRALISGCVDYLLNGEQAVAAVLDDRTFVYACDSAAGAIVGNRATVQRLATRNNVILVYNLNNEAWESVDTLPAGFYADWLRAADYGARRRLWVIDALAGPSLYEERDADEIGDVTGGVALPFDLPVELSEANFATVAVPGRIRTRAIRWGYRGTLDGGLTGDLSASMSPRKVRRCEARATLDADSAGTLTLLVRTPNNRVWSSSREFNAAMFTTPDAPLRKLCGERGLEAQVEIVTTGGRPTIRSVEVETAAVGRVEE